jgi:hypothetical protein
MGSRMKKTGFHCVSNELELTEPSMEYTVLLKTQSKLPSSV